MLLSQVVRGRDGRTQARWLPVCFGHLVMTSWRSELKVCLTQFTATCPRALRLVVLPWMFRMVKIMDKILFTILYLYLSPSPLEKNEPALKIFFMNYPSKDYLRIYILKAPNHLASASCL